MSFWKSLKKMKGINALKGALKFVPGGSQVTAGINTLEKTVKSLKKKPTDKAKQDISQATALEKEASPSSDNSKYILLAVGAVAIYFMFVKK